jgi:hypothetical protein
MANETLELRDEIWKPIPSHPGYEASSFGRVRSVERTVIYRTGVSHCHKGKVLAQFTLWNGYKTTHLGRGNANKYVHQLVARAFIGEPPEGMEVCHWDDCKPNNYLINLRYDTRQSNLEDRIRNGAQNPK